MRLDVERRSTLECQYGDDRRFRDAHSTSIRCGRRCYCLLRQYGQAATFHVNHIRPRSKGGETNIKNLVLQCPYCSLHKADKIDATDPMTEQLSRLFHPLQDSWHEHFVLQPDGTCVGLTSVGRATIDALRMNDPLPRSARALQMLLGLME